VVRVHRERGGKGAQPARAAPQLLAVSVSAPRLAQTFTNIYNDQVDGSNLGISITPDHKLLFQNRSHYVNTETQAQVPYSRRHAWRDCISQFKRRTRLRVTDRGLARVFVPQWRQLESWAEKHPGLHQVLTPDRILFGEWFVAHHRTRTRTAAHAHVFVCVGLSRSGAWQVVRTSLDPLHQPARPLPRLRHLRQEEGCAWVIRFYSYLFIKCIKCIAPQDGS
jgi:hypothetical protein